MFYLGIITDFINFIGNAIYVIVIIIVVALGASVLLLFGYLLTKLVNIIKTLINNRTNKTHSKIDTSTKYNSPDENKENTTEVEIPIEETKSIIHQVTYTFPIKPKNDGKKFEGEIAAQLDLLPKDIYTVYSNTWIPSSYYENEITEIDFLVVSKYKIFVIEAKDLFGHIKMNPKNPLAEISNDYSTQTTGSPIKQNKGHCKALNNILPFEIKLESMIVLSERCTSSVTKDKKVFVGHLNNAIKYIKNRNNYENYSDKTVEIINNCIKDKQVTDKERISKQIKTNQERSKFNYYKKVK